MFWEGGDENRDLSEPRQEDLLSTFNLESGFLGQKSIATTLSFPRGCTHVLEYNYKPHGFPKAKGKSGVTRGERVVDGFSTKVMKGRKEASKAR